MADIRIYECFNADNTIDLTLEVWASSTKYPDAKFYFSDFNKSEWVAEKHQVFQWLLEYLQLYLYIKNSFQYHKIGTELHYFLLVILDCKFFF